MIEKEFKAQKEVKQVWEEKKKLVMTEGSKKSKSSSKEIKHLWEKREILDLQTCQLPSLVPNNRTRA